MAIVTLVWNFGSPGDTVKKSLPPSLLLWRRSSLPDFAHTVALSRSDHLYLLIIMARVKVIRKRNSASQASSKPSAKSRLPAFVRYRWTPCPYCPDNPRQVYKIGIFTTFTRPEKGTGEQSTKIFWKSSLFVWYIGREYLLTNAAICWTQLLHL